MHTDLSVNVSPVRRPIFGRAGTPAVLIVAIPLIFVIVAYLWPITMMLRYSIRDGEVSDALPQTTSVLRRWSGDGVPPMEVRQIVANEIASAYKAETLSRAAMRMNRDIPGMHSLLMSSGRTLLHQTIDGGQLPPLVDVDARWGENSVWREMKSAGNPYTTKFLLNALDVGAARQSGEDANFHRIYVVRTFVIGISVTVICVIVGVPFSCIIASVNEKTAQVMLFCVLVPFWMSLLVRTSAWVMLLRQDGIVNKTLQALRIIEQPLHLIYSRIGLYVAMVHILLPFLILPVFTVAKTIPKSHGQAAQSLGAGTLASFFKVCLPQLMPGIVSGALFVFILAVGFYITPALIGGSQDQMLSYLIQQSAFTTANWGMASSVAVILLLSVGLFVTLVWVAIPKSWRIGLKY